MEPRGLSPYPTVPNDYRIVSYRIVSYRIVLYCIVPVSTLIDHAGLAPISLQYTTVEFFVIESQWDSVSLNQVFFDYDAELTAEGTAYLDLFGNFNRHQHEKLENFMSLSCYNHVGGINAAVGNSPVQFPVPENSVGRF